MSKMYNLPTLSNNLTQLPPHITLKEAQKIKEAVKIYWNEKGKLTPKRKQMIERDELLLHLLWVTGGRITDICNLELKDFNFDIELLNLKIKKTKKTIQIPIDKNTLYMIKSYARGWEIKKELFPITRQRAWQTIQKYSKIAEIKNAHPHKWRHGLAIHLMSQGIPIPVISARLGHSNVFTTMNNYMKITPEIQRKALEDIKW